MFKKLILILIGLILIVTGAFWSFQNKKFSSSPIGKSEKNKLTKTVPSPTPLIANFHETGTVLNWDEASEATSSAWIFLYETAEAATESAKLIFDQNSFIQLKNGDQVKVTAFKQDQTLTVINLEKVIPDQLEGALP